MAIEYVKVRREIHVGQNPGEKFIARLWRNNDIDLKTIAEEISNASTMSSADVIGCLVALEESIAKYVLNGNAVKLGTLGSFVPAISCKACNSVDDVSSDAIRRAKCLFKPSVKFKNLLEKANFHEKNLSVKGLIE